MRAVWYADFGSAAEVLQSGEMEMPEPGLGEVRVCVVASGINPVDTKRRRGGRGPMPAPRVVPHFDGAGIIDAVGPGVPDSRIGERVWLYEAQWNSVLGSAAEFVVLAADRAVRLPDHTTFAEGACLGIPAMTAHRCVFADGPVGGKTVLVTGGAGAVGGYAVQFSKLGGARVIATVSSDEKAAVAKSHGADHVIDYKNEDVVARVDELTGGEGVGRIVEVEFGGNLETSVEIIRPNGVIAAYASDAVLEPSLPFYRLVYKNATVHHVLVFVMSDGAKQAAVADIGQWLESGDLHHHVGPRFPLDEAAAAHQAVEKGAFGSVVLDIGGET
jgi:NADPH:quinone reductase